MYLDDTNFLVILENSAGKPENGDFQHFLFFLSVVQTRVFVLNHLPNDKFWTLPNKNSWKNKNFKFGENGKSIFLKGRKHCGKRIHFSFSNTVFKRLLLLTRKNQDLFGMGQRNEKKSICLEQLMLTAFSCVLLRFAECYNKVVLGSYVRDKSFVVKMMGSLM